MEEIMKSAPFKIGLLLLAMTFITACSGGGKAGSSTNVTLKIGTTDTTKKFFLGLVPLAAASNIPSIVKKITITVTASDITAISQSIPVTSAAQSLVATFSVPNGSARVITVTAEDGYGNTTFNGASTPLELNGTDTSVQIQMVEDIKAAITARLLLYFKDTMESKIKAGTLTAADLDPFYVSAPLYGINNGATRDLVVAEDVKDFSRTFLRKTMSTIQIDAPQPDSQNIKYTVTGKGTFSDGSYGFPDDGFVMMKENGEWKFAGNNYKSDIDFRSASYRWIGPGALQPLTGLKISVRENIDPVNPVSPVIYSATVTGPGLGTGIEMIRGGAASGAFDGLSFSSNSCIAGIPTIPTIPPGTGIPPGTSIPTIPAIPNQLPGGNELFCMTDAAISSIPVNSTYTFTLKDINNNVIETRTFKLPVRPYTNTELTSAHFPGLSIPPAYPATDGHFLADARIGGPSGLTITFSKPTAYTPSWLEAEFNYMGWFGTVNSGFFINRALLLSETSTTFASFLPLLSTNALASVRSEDFGNKRETRTFWLFNGPVTNPPLSFNPPTNNQVINGVTVSTPAWTFGSAPPTVSWSGFSSIELLDIYLLADDPAKILLPAPTFGNPFPNVFFWSKITGPISGIAGSTTLSTPPELLGITGTACRVLLVSNFNGNWAISQPFYIGP
jgi:hypothetical protein